MLFAFDAGNKVRRSGEQRQVNCENTGILLAGELARKVLGNRVFEVVCLLGVDARVLLLDSRLAGLETVSTARVAVYEYVGTVGVGGGSL